VARRRGRRRKKLLDDLKDRRGYSHLKDLDRTMWRNRFGGGFGPVVRQNTEWMNELYYNERCKKPKNSVNFFKVLFNNADNFYDNTVSVTGERMSVENLPNDNDKGKTKVTGEKSVPIPLGPIPISQGVNKKSAL